MQNLRSLWILLGLTTATFLANCASVDPSAPAVATREDSGFGSSTAGAKSLAPAPESATYAYEKRRKSSHRPGLATGWGETRRSPVRGSSFQRANSRTPIAKGMMYYNGDSGSKAMAGYGAYRSRGGGKIVVGDGLINFGVLGSWGGNYLPAYVGRGNQRFVVGRGGSRYALKLENLTDSRLEVVASVDGLDVVDGEKASFSKRGYILQPGQSIKVEGFRRSYEKVAAFRFGKVKDSYSNRRHGTTANVGVLGVALFHEKGDQPVRYSWRQDVGRRNAADPFPDAPNGAGFAKPSVPLLKTVPVEFSAERRYGIAIA